MSKIQQAGCLFGSLIRRHDGEINMSFHSDLFGWDYVWRHFADQKGGQVIEGATGLDGIVIPAGDGSTVLITPFVHHGKKRSKGTTVMTAFHPADDFVFSIQTEKLSDQVGKAFGMQDVQVQDAEFDGKFLIQGNDDARIQRLFENVYLKDAILLQPPTQLRIEHDSSHFDPEWTVRGGSHVLVYRYDHLMEKIDQLQTAFDVVTTTLVQLAVLGAVSGKVPMRSNSSFEEEVAPQVQSHRLHSPLLDPT